MSVLAKLTWPFRHIAGSGTGLYEKDSCSQSTWYDAEVCDIKRFWHSMLAGRMARDLFCREPILNMCWTSDVRHEQILATLLRMLNQNASLVPAGLRQHSYWTMLRLLDVQGVFPIPLCCCSCYTLAALKLQERLISPDMGFQPAHGGICCSNQVDLRLVEKVFTYGWQTSNPFLAQLASITSTMCAQDILECTIYTIHRVAITAVSLSKGCSSCSHAQHCNPSESSLTSFMNRFVRQSNRAL